MAQRNYAEHARTTAICVNLVLDGVEADIREELERVTDEAASALRRVLALMKQRRVAENAAPEARGARRRSRSVPAHSRGLSIAGEVSDRLTLDPPSASSDEAGPPLRDEDYLILSTIHSAKGQEWRSVFILNAVTAASPPTWGRDARTTSKRSDACSTSP